MLISVRKRINYIRLVDNYGHLLTELMSYKLKYEHLVALMILVDQ